jgi:hypothetical protein
VLILLVRVLGRFGLHRELLHDLVDALRPLRAP